MAVGKEVEVSEAPLVYCRPDECSYCIALARNLETALAKLAALKGQRCETCRMAAACDQFLNFMGNAVRELDSCSEWQAREAE